MESEALLPPMDFQSPPKPPKSFGFARPDQNVIEPPASGRPGRGRLAAVRRLSPTLDAAKNGRIGDGRPLITNKARHHGELDSQFHVRRFQGTAWIDRRVHLLACNPGLEVQRLQWEALHSWQQSLATFNKDVWEQWTVRYAGGVPIDG